MRNLRVIYDNAADRATVSTSATAAGLGENHLLTDTKAQICRSTSNILTITSTWTASETISAAILAFTNLSSTATVRVQLYTNEADASPVFDTGTVNAGAVALTSKVGVNSLAYGGGRYARAWFAPYSAKKVVITVVDAGGTVEVGRLILGDYWEPKIGVEQGATMSLSDTSKHVRTEAGNLVTDVGVRYKKQSLLLPALDVTDRAKLWDILWANGMSTPLFLSLYPNNADAKLEQVHQIYGKLVVAPVMDTPYFNTNSATIEIEEV